MVKIQNGGYRQEILIIGGEINNIPTKNVIKMIIDENNENLNIRFEESTPMLSARTDLASIYWKNQVFSFGFNDERKYTMEHINILTQEQKEEGTLYDNMIKTVPIIFNDNLLIVGGKILYNEIYLEWPHIYMLKSKCLKENICDSKNWIYKSELKTSRHQCAVCIYDNKLFVCGGYRYNNKEISSVEVYNKHTNKWNISKSMMYPRARFSLFVYEDELYAVGGNNNNSTTNIEKMDKITQEWKIVTDLDKNRNGCSSILVGSKIFLIGGNNIYDWTYSSMRRKHYRKLINDYETTFDFYDLKERYWASKDRNGKYFSENSRRIYLPSSYSIGKLIGKKKIYSVSYAQAVNITPSHNYLIRNRNNSNKYNVDNILFRDNVNDILFNASKYNKPNMIKFLIEIKGADINYKNKDGITSLMIAIIYYNLEIVTLLLDLNIDINLLDNYNKSALWYACYHKNIDMVKLLLSEKANINIGLPPILVVLNENNYKLNNENKILINSIQLDIFNELMKYYPLITKDLVQIKNNTQINKYIDDVISNFNKFSKYTIKNNLLETFNSKSFFNIIILVKELSTENFIDLIYEYINSIPEINNNNYNKTYPINNNEMINIDLISKIFNNYTKFIYEFIYYAYFKYNKTDTFVGYEIYALRPLNINKDKELNDLIRLINSPQFVFKRYRIDYGTSINYGGPSREFYNKVQIQLNKITKNLTELNSNIKKIDNNKITFKPILEKQLLKIESKEEGKITPLNKRLIQKLKNNLSEGKIKEKEEKLNRNKQNLIGKKNKIKNDLQFNVNLSLEIDTLTKIKILKLSKINKNPIYLEDIELQNIILKMIESQFSSNKARIAYNLFKFNYELIFTKRLLNNNIENNVNIDSINDSIWNEIFEGKFYVDIYDFYLSHFINVKLNIENIIQKMDFVTDQLSNIELDNFKNKFKKLLESLDEDELKLFNMVISGSAIEQSKYIINIYRMMGPNSIYPKYHTCFSAMEITHLNLFNDTYLNFESNVSEICKTAFVDSLNITLGIGFNMA